MSNYELRDIRSQKSGHLDQRVSTDAEPGVVVIGANKSQVELDSNGQPIDTYNVIFIILLLHGIGTLMPWNMFINAEDYFRDYKLTTPSASNGTFIVPTDTDQEALVALRKNFISYLSVAAQLPNVIFNGLNLLVNMGSGNLKLRVNFTLTIEAIIFAVTIILAFLDSSRWPGAFFSLTMVSVVVLNMASGIYQNCVFGIGAKFPGRYTNAILIGSNFSGTFTSIANLLTKWLAPKAQEAAIYYFVTALFVILICIVSYNLLHLNPFFRHYDESAEPNGKLEIETANEKVTNQDTNNNTANDATDTLRATVEAMVPRPSKDDQDNSFMGELNKKWLVLRKCWPQCLNVFLTFYVTLALFPAVLANVPQLQGYFSDKYFTSVACFLVFNVFAMIGNLISSWTTWPGPDKVWILVVVRIIFVPFFLFCNFNPKTRHWPVLISSDIAFMFGNFLIALSSGYLSSLCMMFASSNLSADEAPKAGMLAAFFLILGIFLGINSSFFLTWIVEL